MGKAGDKRALVAVDLGAQSCRVSLLRWTGDGPEIRVLHRFPNGPVTVGKTLRWDIQKIFDGVKTGLCLCAQSAPEGIASIGIDGWGVDYVRLDEKGSPVGDPFCYRDERNTRAMKEVLSRIPAERMYELTGIQLLSLNTVFQLYADTESGIDQRRRWLNLPEYVTYLLGGKAVSEYTNATHTQLVKLGRLEWCEEIFQNAGLSLAAAPEIVPTGTVVGMVQGELSRLRELRDAQLIVPACHDTASAIAAIPAQGDDWAFISSGTWSLVGTVLDSPCVSGEARRMNFTNLGGVGGAICFLKNVNGMWLLQQCMEEWGRKGQACSLEELVRRCEGMTTPEVLVDVDAGPLTTPGEISVKINAQLEAAGGARIETGEKGGVARMANVIFHSLAKRYADVLGSVGRIAGKKLKRLFIAGGGSKNAYLNRLTAERTGLEVIPASSECTTIGNLAVQVAAADNSERSGVSAGNVARYAELLGGRFLALP